MISLLTIARAVHFGSCLLLQSVFVVLFLVLRPAWDEPGGEATLERQTVCRRLHRVLVVCLLLSFASGFIWLWLAIAGMNGSSLSETLQPSLFWMVLTQTPPGHVWMVRAGLALVFAASLFFLPGALPGTKSPSLWVCAASATLLTASLAWHGHAGAAEGPGHDLQLGGDVLHLIAAGAWPGGLVPLAIFFGCYLKKDRHPASLLVARAATRKFSALSLTAVGVLLVSGFVNSYYLVGSFEALISTKYGRLLILKLIFFVAMTCLGAWNLFVSKRRLGATFESLSADSQGRALAIVARNVAIEIGLGTLVLIVVGSLGTMPPALHAMMGM